MRRETYKTISESNDSDSYLLDAVRKIFVQGVCLTYHPENVDDGRDLANRAWDCTYKEEAIKMLGLE